MKRLQGFLTVIFTVALNLCQHLATAQQSGGSSGAKVTIPAEASVNHMNGFSPEEIKVKLRLLNVD